MNTMSTAMLPWLTHLSQGVMRASLLGSAAIPFMLLLRRALRGRLAPGTRCLLWLPVAGLLICPRLPDLGFSMERPAPPVAEVTTVVAADKPQFIVRHEGPGRPIAGVVQEAPLTLAEKLALVWAAGFVLLVLAWTGGYLWLRRRVARHAVAVPPELKELFAECCRRMRVRHAPAIVAGTTISAPALMGLLRPVLLVPATLPAAISQEELRLVLMHEAGHVRRRDLPLHWLSLLIVAAHWFNPLCWLAAWLFRADREAACDAAVLRACDDDRRGVYGRTLLKLQAGVDGAPRLRPLVGVLGSTGMLRQRIVEIARFGQGSRLAGGLSLAAAALAATAIALIAAEPPKRKHEPSSPASKVDTFAAQTLVTRVFKVRPDFLGDEDGRKLTARQKLTELGIFFPEGASSVFNPATSQLIVKNTEANLQLVAKIVAGLSTGPAQVYISSKLVVFKEGTAPEGPRAPPQGMVMRETYTDAQFQVIMRALGQSDKVKTLVVLPAITMRGHSKGRVELVRELIYGTDFDDKGKALATENTVIGATIGVEPQVAGHGTTIDLVLQPAIAGVVQWSATKTQGADIRRPVIARQKATVSVALPVGSTVALAGKAAIPAFLLDPEAKGEDALLAKEYQIILFCTAQLVRPLPPPPSPGHKPGQRVKLTAVTCDMTWPKDTKDKDTSDPLLWLSKVLEAKAGAQPPPTPATTGVVVKPLATPPPQIMALSGVLTPEQTQQILAAARAQPGTTVSTPVTQITGADHLKAAFDLAPALPRREATVEPAIGPDGYTLDLNISLPPSPPGPVVTTSVTVWDKQTVVLGGLIDEDAKARHGALVFITAEMVGK